MKVEKSFFKRARLAFNRRITTVRKRIFWRRRAGKDQERASLPQSERRANVHWSGGVLDYNKLKRTGRISDIRVVLEKVREEKWDQDDYDTINAIVELNRDDRGLYEYLRKIYQSKTEDPLPLHIDLYFSILRNAEVEFVIQDISKLFIESFNLYNFPDEEDLTITIFEYLRNRTDIEHVPIFLETLAKNIIKVHTAKDYLRLLEMTADLLEQLLSECQNTTDIRKVQQALKDNTKELFCKTLFFDKDDDEFRRKEAMAEPGETVIGPVSFRAQRIINKVNIKIMESMSKTAAQNGPYR
jgi:hypothetical protein